MNAPSQALAPDAEVPEPPVLLEVSALETHHFVEEGIVRSVDGVSFSVREGQTLGIIGESGCGKSVTALSIMRLIQPPGRIVGGSISLSGENLLTATERRMRAIRGNEIAMIFQEPLASLNPVLTIGFQISEAINLHQPMPKHRRRAKAIEMLREVGIPSPEQRVDDYPHQLSGGMRQRVMIAMALSCNPRLLIADEPTTALDVTIQAQILDLIRSLQARLSTSVLLITHDLGVVAELADHVVVMYLGQVVERAPVTALFDLPLHPYTIGLMRSTLRLDREDDDARLDEIAGSVPNPLHTPTGCRFHPRCERATDICRREEPVEREFGPDHFARCWHVEST
ncbi:ABC transporter ATP-binding protein [Frigidibacter sp. ROC022]|uniref:ABC transporter ATP-binding protein n=1 Tax=Frigidibacter sp. ROC022 TaxID=2971796 RepID=UPI00215A25DF|nr:ABC transporter ATP-binding protein [Frigidibacter sp. ROC022]MCR8724666.1 ABC transporter ATP-binding protein [Frigidibacter sp. ROC022]